LNKTSVQQSKVEFNFTMLTNREHTQTHRHTETHTHRHTYTQTHIHTDTQKHTSDESL